VKIIKKKNILIIAIVVLVLAIIGATVAIIITNKAIATPEPIIEQLDKDSYKQTFLVSWTAVDDAIGYEVEYKYEMKDDAITRLKIKSASISLDRIKGKFSIRVKACAYFASRDSDFSNWTVMDVSGIILDAPTSIKVDYVPSVGYYCVLKELWEGVNYTYKGELKRIAFYEVAVVSPGKTLEEELLLSDRNDRIMSENALLNYRIYKGVSGTYKLYVRAVNDKGMFGEFGETPDEPIELYYTYEDGEWAYAEYTV
jgi:hypothetical protein